MSDLTSKYISHCETIGDVGSSLDELNFDRNSSEADRDDRTNILSRIIISGIDLTLTIILLPFNAFQQIYQNDHLMVMLRVILEVGLELIMWLVLAGVSILTSAALIFDDLYCGKSGSESYRRLVKNCGSSSGREEDSQSPAGERRYGEGSSSATKKNEWAEETPQSGSRRGEDNDRISRSSSPRSRDKNRGNGSAKNDAKFSEEIGDEGSVNFSFYKPLRRSPAVNDDRKPDKEASSQRF